MNLVNATSFTQYPEGSPLHPSWPAMHSAASSASLWLAVVANLTDEQYCQVLRTDYAVAYARTVAGGKLDLQSFLYVFCMNIFLTLLCCSVHYPSDNIAGLNMGQNVVAHELAGHLAEVYGADKAAVEAKIARLRFDWATYFPEDCSVVYGVKDVKA